MTLPDEFDGALLKALGHPLRLRIVEAITERGEASPVALAREFQQPLATVSHHTRVLRDLGWIELVRTQPRRGAVEHFYRATTRPFISDGEWAQLPVAMRRGLARQTLRRVFAEASQAGGAGGFDDPGTHLDRMPLELDARGWRELSEALTAVLKRADLIQRRSDARRMRAAGADGSVTTSELAILHFRIGGELSPTAPGREGAPRHEQRPSLP